MTTSAQTCRHCASILTSKHSVSFCNRKCANQYYNSRRNRKPLVSCEQCGQAFQKRAAQPGRFCSHHCKNEWQRSGLCGASNPNWKGGPEERVCLNCHTQFLASRTQLLLGLGKFCSSRCAGQFKPDHIRRKIGEMTCEHFMVPVVRQRHREGLIRS